MKVMCSRLVCLALAWPVWLHAAEPTAITKSTAPASQSSPALENPELAADLYELETLTTKNKLAAERLTEATNALREEITRLKLERELLLEKQALESAKRDGEHKQKLSKIDQEKTQLERENDVAKMRAEKLANDLKTLQNETSMEITRLQNEISSIETNKKRAEYTDSKPVYLENPLKDDGRLVISDRRILLNGMISSSTADYITSRIQYWNNKDRKLPIFIVIDSSPGGSVMAGYRILRAMESSDAPVHVVVKSFAASMAAAITTLAKESYAYPNAIILHHQISSSMSGQLNLTQQREFAEESQRWWVRLGTPVATKMGLTIDDFIKEMYRHSSSGDWSEFGDEAKRLKWVNHIIQGIDDTSITKDPDSTPPPSKSDKSNNLTEDVDAKGKPIAWLPRIDPKDVYFLYNPDGYYRLR